MKLQKNQKLVMIGDSITDAGRARPAGEGLFGALGTGYVGMVDAMLGAWYPQLAIRVVNQGCGGDTVRHLKARWQSDVLDLKPDWLSIMIGTNDVWRQFDSPRQKELHVPLAEYRATLDELIKQTLPGLKGLVLMTPYYLEPLRRDAMRSTMDRYGAVVKKLADKHGAILVDTQAAFENVLKNCHSAAVSWDRVHPSAAGHTVLARAFLSAMGFRW